MPTVNGQQSPATPPALIPEIVTTSSDLNSHIKSLEKYFTDMSAGPTAKHVGFVNRLSGLIRDFLDRNQSVQTRTFKNDGPLLANFMISASKLQYQKDSDLSLFSTVVEMALNGQAIFTKENLPRAVALLIARSVKSQIDKLTEEGVLEFATQTAKRIENNLFSSPMFCSEKDDVKIQLLVLHLYRCAFAPEPTHTLKSSITRGLKVGRVLQLAEKRLETTDKKLHYTAAGILMRSGIMCMRDAPVYFVDPERTHAGDFGYREADVSEASSLSMGDVDERLLSVEILDGERYSTHALTDKQRKIYGYARPTSLSQVGQILTNESVARVTDPIPLLDRAAAASANSPFVQAVISRTTDVVNEWVPVSQTKSETKQLHELIDCQIKSYNCSCLRYNAIRDRIDGVLLRLSVKNGEPFRNELSQFVEVINGVGKEIFTGKEDVAALKKIHEKLQRDNREISEKIQQIQELQLKILASEGVTYQENSSTYKHGINTGSVDDLSQVVPLQVHLVLKKQEKQVLDEQKGQLTTSKLNKFARATTDERKDVSFLSKPFLQRDKPLTQLTEAGIKPVIAAAGTDSFLRSVSQISNAKQLRDELRSCESSIDAAHKLKITERMHLYVSLGGNCYGPVALINHPKFIQACGETIGNILRFMKKYFHLPVDQLIEFDLQEREHRVRYVAELVTKENRSSLDQYWDDSLDLYLRTHPRQALGKLELLLTKGDKVASKYESQIREILNISEGSGESQRPTDVAVGA